MSGVLKNHKVKFIVVYTAPQAENGVKIGFKNLFEFSGFLEIGITFKTSPRLQTSPDFPLKAKNGSKKNLNDQLIRNVTAAGRISAERCHRKSCFPVVEHWQ